MFEYFTEKSIAVIMAAQEEARRSRHRYVGTEQILLGLIQVQDSLAAAVLAESGVTLDAARREVEAIVGQGTRPVAPELPFTPKTKQILEQGLDQARRLNHPYVGPEHLLLSLIQDQDNVAVKVLNQLGVSLEEMQQRIIQRANAAAPVGAGRQSSTQRSTRNRQSTLLQFGRDLTQLAAAGQIDPMVGRQTELERIIQILGRRTKNNPVLVGEPGVGKTAIAEGLAHRIVDQTVPEFLLDKQIISLDMGALLAGTRMRANLKSASRRLLKKCGNRKISFW